MERLNDSQLLKLINQKAIRLSGRREEEAFISFLRVLLAKHGLAWIRNNNSEILEQWKAWRQEFLRVGRREYIDKILKNPKYNVKKEDFLIITIGFIAVTIILAFIGFIINVNDRPRVPSCNYNETDAKNTLAALASYFSEPDRNEVPTVEYLEEYEDLYINLHSTVIIDGPIDKVRVTVIDKTGNCPLGKRYEVYMDGFPGEWYDE